MKKTLRFAVVGCGLFFVSTVANASKWPEIPQSDWEVTEVPGSPNAAAVILLREGLVHMSEETPSSFIEVYTRIKILTAEGVDYGTVSLMSSEYMRTKKIEGRTHLPDGTIVEMQKNATFEKEFSDYYDTTIASAALPKVVPGAIVEYRFTTYFDYIMYTRPWYFQAEIPTIVNRLTFELPRSVTFRPIVVSTLHSVKLHRDVKKGPKGLEVNYKMENVPPVPDEPYRFPFADLSSRVIMLPTIDYSSATPFHIFESWENLVDIVVGSSAWGYTKFRSNSRAANSKAKEVATGSQDALGRAIAVYRWVRDEIDLEPYVGIWVGKKSADEVFKARTCDEPEKALLLEVMLKAIKVDVAIGWTNSRGDGRISTDIPNSGQFNTMLVIADIDGKRYFLDPSDRRLAFGKLSPQLHGMPCLKVKKSSHEWIDIPPLPPSESIRHATVNLAVCEEGIAGGTGNLDLTGAHAWRRMRWRDSAEDTVASWRKWLENGFPGYDISDVMVNEDLESTHIDLQWKMLQRADEKIADEVSINVAAPLAISSNPFVLEPKKRLTPVQFAFVDTERLTLTVSWPENWIIEDIPRLKNLSNSSGDFVTSFSVDENARVATIERNFTLHQVEYLGGEAYNELRNLYLAAVANDAEEILLFSE